MPPLIDHPDDEEERARRKAVVDHLQDRPFHGGGVERENTEHDKPEVADAGKGDEPFQVLLHDADPRAVNDPDEGQRHENPHAVIDRGIGKQRQTETQETVSPHLQEHGRQQHAAHRGRLRVGVG